MSAISAIRLGRVFAALLVLLGLSTSTTAQPEMSDAEVQEKVEEQLGEICQLIPGYRGKPYVMDPSAPMFSYDLYNIIQYERFGIFTVQLLEPAIKEQIVNSVNEWLDQTEDVLRKRLRAARISYTGLGPVGDSLKVRITRSEDFGKAATEINGMVQSLQDPIFGTDNNLYVNHVAGGLFTILPSLVTLNALVNQALSKIHPNVKIQYLAELSNEHPEFFCPIGAGKGLATGKRTIKEVIRIQRTEVPDESGMLSPAYYVQATLAYVPSPIGSLVDAGSSQDQKAQFLFQYDFLKKSWRVRASQFTNESEPFSDLLDGIRKSP